MFIEFIISSAERLEGFSAMTATVITDIFPGRVRILIG